MLKPLAQWCDPIRSALESVHPLTPWLALSGAIWLVVYAVRRWLPGIWVRLAAWPSHESPVSHVLQALPSVVIGAAWAAGTTPGADVWTAVGGALSGALAPVAHHILKALPVPYQGPVRDVAYRAARGVWPGLIVLFSSGCGGSAPEPNVARELCYGDERLRYQEAAAKCDTDECIDALDEETLARRAECP